MTDKIANKILEMTKDKLMSEPESNRDWELITALDISIEALNCKESLEKKNEFLMQQIRLWQKKAVTEQQGSDCVENEEVENETPYEERPKGKWKVIGRNRPNNIWHLFCPKCNCDMLTEFTSYCPNCGEPMEEINIAELTFKEANNE